MVVGGARYIIQQRRGIGLRKWIDEDRKMPSTKHVLIQCVLRIGRHILGMDQQQHLNVLVDVLEFVLIEDFHIEQLLQLTHHRPWLRALHGITHDGKTGDYADARLFRFA